MAVVEQFTVSSPVACDVVVSATFDAELTGTQSYWNKASGYVNLAMSYPGAALSSPSYAIAGPRARYAFDFKVPLPANVTATVALQVSSGIGCTVTIHAGSLRAEVIKR